MELLTNNVTLEHYIILSCFLFAIGMCGLLLSKRNVISILMSIELMLLAANINFLAFSAFYQDLTGQIATIIILTIAAAEASIGLAIVVNFYRARGTISIEEINKLKG